MEEEIILEYQKLIRKYAFILNPDAFLEENCLEEIAKSSIYSKR